MLCNPLLAMQSVLRALFVSLEVFCLSVALQALSGALLKRTRYRIAFRATLAATALQDPLVWALAPWGSIALLLQQCPCHVLPELSAPSQACLPNPHVLIALLVELV